MPYRSEARASASIGVSPPARWVAPRTSSTSETTSSANARPQRHCSTGRVSLPSCIRMYGLNVGRLVLRDAGAAAATASEDSSLAEAAEIDGTDSDDKSDSEMPSSSTASLLPLRMKVDNGKKGN
jgi:hypothetical protein